MEISTNTVLRKVSTVDLAAKFDEVVETNRGNKLVIAYTYITGEEKWIAIDTDAGREMMKSTRKAVKSGMITCLPRNSRSFERRGLVFRTLVLSDGELSTNETGYDPTGLLFGFSVMGRTLCFIDEKNRDLFLNFVLNGKNTPFEYDEVCYSRCY